MSVSRVDTALWDFTQLACSWHWYWSVFVQDEFSGFTDDDVRRVSKRSSAVGVLRRNLLRRSQPAASGRPVNTQHVRKRRTVDAKPVSPPSSPGIVTPSPLTSPQSDSSPTRGSLKGNIKVRLLLGRYKLFPTPKERQRSKTSLVKAERKDAAGIIKKKEKRRRLNSHQSDDSAVSSSGESRSEERRVGKECRSRWSPYH